MAAGSSYLHASDQPVRASWAVMAPTFLFGVRYASCSPDARNHLKVAGKPPGVLLASVRHFLVVLLRYRALPTADSFTGQQSLTRPAGLPAANSLFVECMPVAHD